MRPICRKRSIKKLDRELAERRVYPAIHIPQSGTRNDDRLYHAEEMPRVLDIRRQLSQLPVGDAIARIGEGTGEAAPTHGAQPDQIPVRTWPVIEAMGLVFVWMGEGAPPPLPTFAEGPWTPTLTNRWPCSFFRRNACGFLFRRDARGFLFG